MEHFNESIEKLNTLLAGGIITQQDFDQRRQKLVDDFIGVPKAGGSNAGRNPAIARGRPSFKPRGQYFGGGAAVFGGGFRGAFGGGYGGYGAVRAQPYFFRKPRAASTAIKVQPVPDGTTVDDLKVLFVPYGNCVSGVIKEGTPRHAYLNFASPDEANAAAATGFVNIQGQDCLVTLSWRARPAVPEGEPTNGIGIFNIPFTMTSDEVQAMLAEYPGFQAMKYVTNKVGIFRGYVFAYFDTVDNATYAKSVLLGLAIGDQVLDVKYSNRPAEEVLADAVA